MELGGQLEQRTQRLGQIIAGLDAALDWELLGTLYCSEGGEDFFCEEQRDALAESGLEFAHDLGTRLVGTQGASAGASLYLGAAVFELLPALFEHLVLERRVVLVNLGHEESLELNRGLTVVEKQAGIELPRIEIGELASVGGGPFDHVWMTSVLTDPEAFPALHDRIYQREGGELATNLGHFESELDAATELVGQVLDRTAGSFWFTTTDEELPLIRGECEARGLELKTPGTGRLSGIVGDPVRHCYVVASSPEVEPSPADSPAEVPDRPETAN